MQTDKEKPCFIQHKVRKEVKDWIEAEATRRDRSQAWFLNHLIEGAFARATTQPQGAAA
ncbi:hypothetical protein HNP33_003701 [Comamonas odontotermitis]|uniref:Toxin-antitoxin system HicB family antitoxin n=1 Tax=Comamonas odontotermitis TaxID=379895 RepID=A0ABR6RKJ8_9BURK|nr:hypothetical protein [Comamonas odontotermitis]